MKSVKENHHKCYEETCQHLPYWIFHPLKWPASQLQLFKSGKVCYSRTIKCSLHTFAFAIGPRHSAILCEPCSQKPRFFSGFCCQDSLYTRGLLRCLLGFLVVRAKNPAGVIKHEMYLHLKICNLFPRASPQKPREALGMRLENTNFIFSFEGMMVILAAAANRSEFERAKQGSTLIESTLRHKSTRLLQNIYECLKK